MADDDRDLARRLPDPPPPRPDRRDRAIETAVARFAGVSQPADRPVAAPPRRWSTMRPQLGALVAAVLVITIGVPVWLSGDLKTPPVEQAARPVPSHRVEPRAAAVPDRLPAIDAPATQDVAAEPQATTSEPTQPAPAERDVRPSAAPAPAPAIMDESAPPPPPPPPPPPSPPPPAPPPPPAFIASGEGVVVTGSRVAAPAARPPGTGAGARSRCTVDDPRRSLAACRDVFGGATAGPAGRAQALVGDGVLHAWRGDDAAALATFDQAIAVAPVADGLVNRALLRMRRGDDTGALADLDRVVRSAPGSARGYHYRSIVLARLGKAERAETDARRAAALDRDDAAAPRER